MILQHFVFFDSSSTGTTSNTLAVPIDAEALSVQVTGNSSIDITVQGKADSESGNWTTLSVLNLNGFGTASKITADGIYMIGCSGLTQIRVVNGGTAGSVKVFGFLVK